MFQRELRSHFVCMPNILTLPLIVALLLLVPESAAQQANSSTAQQAFGGIENRRNEFGGVESRSTRPRGLVKPSEMRSAIKIFKSGAAKKFSLYAREV